MFQNIRFPLRSLHVIHNCDQLRNNYTLITPNLILVLKQTTIDVNTYILTLSALSSSILITL